MKNLVCIRGIQYYLSYLGYNLNITKNIYVKLCLWIVLALNLFAVSFSAIFESVTVYNISLIQNGIIKYQSFLYWSYYHILIFKISSIGILVSTLSVHLKHRDARWCYCLSFTPIVWTLIGNSMNLLAHDAIELSIDKIRDFFNISNTTTNNAILLTLKTIQYTRVNWTVASDINYLIIFYILYVAKRHLLTTIDFRAKLSIFTQSIHQVADRVIDIHAMFESTMSIFPFLTISYLFCAVSQSVYFIRQFSNCAVSTWLILTLGFRILSALSTVFITNHLNSELKDSAREICKKINAIESIDSVKKSVLIQMIKNCFDTPITAWGMFDIDLPLILSFLSSLITFTILFLSDPWIHFHIHISSLCNFSLL